MKSVPILGSWFTFGILALSNPAFADHTRTIVFDGSETATTVQLDGEESHTIYETREVPATCYRDEFMGYRRRCYDEWRERCFPETVCRPYGSSLEATPGDRGHDRRPGPGGPGGGSHCHVETRCRQVVYPICHSEPYYERVPYACTKRESVPVGQELDYRVNADVQVKFNLASVDARPAEGLRLSLDGQDVSLAATSLSGQVLLYVKSTQSVDVLRPDAGPYSPGEKRVRARFEITAQDAGRALSAVNGGIGDLALRGSELSFTLGRMEGRDSLEFGLKLERKRFLGAKRVFEGAVLPGAVSFEERGDRTLVRLALDRLNLSEQIKADKNYRLDLSVGLRPDSVAGRLLNPETLGRPAMVRDREVHSQ